MRSKRVIGALGATVAVTLALSGGTASAHTSSSYRCAYGKKFGGVGRIYRAMSVSPKSLGPTFCKAFNSGFGGRRYTVGRRLGTGQAYCKYTYRKSPILVVGTVFADKRTMGKAFCSIYHPAGWRRS